MKELRLILADVLTGALPLSALPGFLAWQVRTHIQGVTRENSNAERL